MEVLQFIAEGYASKQIAALLDLSIKTVDKHRQSLMETLDRHNIANLTQYAVESGVLEPNTTIDATPDCPVPASSLGEGLSENWLTDGAVDNKTNQRAIVAKTLIKPRRACRRTEFHSQSWTMLNT